LSDIGIAVLDLLNELTDEDVISEDEATDSLINALVPIRDWLRLISPYSALTHCASIFHAVMLVGRGSTTQSSCWLAFLIGTVNTHFRIPASSPIADHVALANMLHYRLNDKNEDDAKAMYTVVVCCIAFGRPPSHSLLR